MGLNTKIEWCDHTLNFWQGCTPVSIGCESCYALRGIQHWGNNPLMVRRSSDRTFYAPLQSRKWKPGDRVFVCSWSDFFHPAADEWRDDAWDVILKRPDLTFLILTKRPENIRKRLPETWGLDYEHVWLGVTAENQEMADWRIPILLQILVSVHFVSCEPLLGPIDPHGFTASCNEIEWVICGGESGPNARPMHHDWPLLLRDQCQKAGVPFFFKAWGEWSPSWYPEPAREGFTKLVDRDGGVHDLNSTPYPDEWCGMNRRGRKAAGRLLDGREWNELPE